VRHDVPADHRFELRRFSRRSGQPLGPALNAQSLVECTLRSRLDIHGHGNRRRFVVEASDLAQALQAGGLRQVGVLKLQGCSVGRGDYLHRLSGELQSRGIDFGYLSAYTTDVQRTYVTTRIGGAELNLHLGWLICSGPTRAAGTGLAAPDVRVVQGTAPVAFAGTRYVPSAAGSARPTPVARPAPRRDATRRDAEPAARTQPSADEEPIRLHLRGD
jgi:hypothetical protein